MFKLIRLKPEDYDFLGVVVFPLLFAYALYELLTGQAPSTWVSVLLLLTGVIGTIIDGSIIYRYFIKKGRK